MPQMKGFFILEEFHCRCSKLLFVHKNCNWLFSLQDLFRMYFAAHHEHVQYVCHVASDFFFCKFTHQSHKYCNWLVFTLQELIWYTLQILHWNDFFPSWLLALYFVLKQQFHLSSCFHSWIEAMRLLWIARFCGKKRNTYLCKHVVAVF